MEMTYKQYNNINTYSGMEMTDKQYILLAEGKVIM